MATTKDWLNRKFTEWEKAQGRSQSYYAFARFLEVSQSELGQWMNGASTPGGDDLVAIARKLGPEIYDTLGLPRPNAQAERITGSLASLPPDIREKLTNAIAEVDATLRRERLQPNMADAHKLAVDILAKHGFRYSG